MKRLSVRRALALLTVVLLVCGAWLGWRWRRAPVSTVARVEVIQTVSPAWSAPLEAALKDLLRAHRELAVSVRFASSVAPSTGAGALGADVWLGPKLDPLAGVARMDFPILAYRRDFVSRGPQSWSEVAAAALEVNQTRQLPYGIALPDNDQLLGGVLGVRGDDGELQATPEGIDLVTQLRGQYRLATVGCSTECAVNLLAAGLSPFAIVSSRDLLELENRLGNLLGVSALPTLPGETGSHRVYASALVVERGSPRSKAQADAIATVAKGLEQVISRDGLSLHIAPTGSPGQAIARAGVLGEIDHVVQRVGRDQTDVGSPEGRIALAAAARRIFQ